jgi:hypothetical protein
MQTLFDNWEAITRADRALKRIGNKWLDYKEDVVGELYYPDLNNEKPLWVLVGYNHSTYDGPLLYDLFAYRGDLDVGELEDQLLTLLDITTPETVEYDVYACGAMELVNTSEESMEFTIGEALVATLILTERDGFELESSLLTQRSIDYLYENVWSVYEDAVRDHVT